MVKRAVAAELRNRRRIRYVVVSSPPQIIVYDTESLMGKFLRQRKVGKSMKSRMGDKEKVYFARELTRVANDDVFK